MPRSAMQSDFSVEREPEPEDAAELPQAIVRTTEASARATKIVMTFTFVMLLALLLLTMIGPHIPAGE